MKPFTRREFIAAGIGGTALLAGAGWLSRGRTSADVIPALVPVVLAGALPPDPRERAAAIAETTQAFHRAVSRLAPAIQEEIGDLLALLAFAPTRILVAGVSSPWSEATPDAITAFLESWRASRSELKRSGYRALTQLIQGSWYDNPLAWKVVGYPGPPEIA
jgi:hypothetical protein